MPKTKIQYRVPYADTDRMGVVYYAHYLVYFERLRNELLREAGFPYSELEAQGLMLPVVEASCNYKNSAGYDDLLSITGWVEEIRGARIRICCEVHRDDELLVTGYTVHACVEVKTRRPVKPPEIFISLVE